jgi:hypothetical protein
LEAEGMQVSYHTFHMVVWRAKRKRTEANSDGKEDGPFDARGLAGAAVMATEERDPLANLRRLEENRPGFVWRGSQKGREGVNGRENTNDKIKR